MGIWDTIRGWFGGADATPPAPAPTPTPATGTLEAARWLAADNNRFGIPVLDLHAVLGGLLSTTRDPANAERAVSWGSKTGANLTVPTHFSMAVDCDLHLPAAADLPDGLLYVPAAMEDKWVLAWRSGQILAARSWTGEVQAVATATHTGDTLHIHRLQVVPGPLADMGELIEVFEWLLRTHALGELHPIPVFVDSAKVLEKSPAAAFGAFGRKAVAAATMWRPLPPSRPLRSDGAVALAVRQEDADRVRALAAEGHSLDSPGTFAAYTPLHVAAAKGNLELVRTLLELGAAVDPVADGGLTPLLTAIVHKADGAVLDTLVDAGADTAMKNEDGFDALHALAEVGHVPLLSRVLAWNPDLERRTGRVQTALHIACGLGHAELVAALLEAGADHTADSPWGTPRKIAEDGGHEGVLKVLP